ncbi:SPDY domain-containing protein [Streptomyces sp. SD15]
MTPAIDAHVRLDTHPTHPSAVTAVLTGTQARVALMGLEAADWTVAADNVLVLARIDHEEPYWAEDAAKHLIAEGITVEIAPRLREAMDEEWTWPNYPMPWCTRSEIREVSNAAQKIHDDICHGQLLIHAHAHDAHTTVAVGSYLHRGGKSVYLHGEDHLRQVADTFDSPAQALLAFEKVHAAEMRPGPAPLTDTERAAIEARSVFDVTAAKSEPSRPEPETVPVYLADAGDHDALLDAFIDAHGEFEKWRTWSDETTHAIHESQTLRIERVHETPAHETAWTVAAYETPVSDRMWVLTATGATPAPVLQELLTHLADGDSWDTAIGTPVDEKMVTAATQPLSDAGWKHTVDGRWIRWTSPDGDAGVQFDAFTAQHPSQNLATWTVWAGPGPDRPTWAITASPHTPSSLLADLSETLAHETGTRQAQPSREHRPRLATSAPAAPAIAAGRTASRSR